MNKIMFMTRKLFTIRVKKVDEKYLVLYLLISMVWYSGKFNELR